MFALVSLELSSGLAVSLGEAAKRFVFEAVTGSKLEEVSYEMLVLTLPRVSSCVCGAFLWRLWGKLQHAPFLKLLKCQNWRKSRIHARFDAPTRLLLCL